MSERVFPREAMTAERIDSGHPEGVARVWLPDHDGADYFTAEFVAAFRPASDLDELVAAARGLVDDEACTFDHHGYCQTHWSPNDDGCVMERMRAALRLWDGEQ